METSFFLFVSPPLFFILIMSSGHEKPHGYKRGKLRTILAWLLALPALADMAFSAYSAVKAQLMYNESDYTIELLYKSMLLPALMLGWAIYIFKSGPLRSKKWIRALKSIIYLFSSVLLLGTSSSNPGTLAVILIIFLALFVITAMLNGKRQHPTKKVINGNSTNDTKPQQPNDKEQMAIHDNSTSDIQRKQFGNYSIKVFIMAAMACAFIFCAIWDNIPDESIYYMGIFYYPWFLLLFCYYTYILWSRGKVTGELILMLPLLQKAHLFKDYSGDLSNKKELLQTILPVLATSIICPFIVALISGKLRRSSFPFFMLAIPPALIIISIIKTYISKWLYSQEQPKNE